MINIETKDKNKPSGKSVLLFSGGLDSLIISKLENVDILLVLKYGSRYSEAEFSAVQNLLDNGDIDKDKVVIKDNIKLGEFERDDAIIPLRNLFFLAFAALYGEKLYLASVYGDRSLDKSLDFFQKFGDLLTYLYSEQHWCEPRQIDILAPYKDTTKTELVAKYLAAGFNPDSLLRSYSCYEGNSDGQHCGECKPCFRKWVSLVNNGIQIPENYFKSNPKEVSWLPEVLPKIEKNEWRGREDNDIKKALGI